MSLMERRRALIAQAKASGKSDMNGWTNGVAYTDLTIVKNSYVQASNGEFRSYNGWDRTSYVPCDGASSITFPPCNQIEAGNVSSNWFFKQDKTPLAGGPNLPFVLSRTSPKTITVPTGAYYFVISSDSAPLAACINAGIVPHRQENHMKYAKLINSTPVYAPNPILHNGLWYGNPPGSVYEDKIDKN